MRAAVAKLLPACAGGADAGGVTPAASRAARATRSGFATSARARPTPREAASVAAARATARARSPTPASVIMAPAAAAAMKDMLLVKPLAATPAVPRAAATPSDGALAESRDEVACALGDAAGEGLLLGVGDVSVGDSVGIGDVGVGDVDVDNVDGEVGAALCELDVVGVSVNVNEPDCVPHPV